jgi:hypothetical protein
MAHYTPRLVTRSPLRALAASVALLLPAVSYSGDKVGAETCKACHPAAYEAWRASPHARARESLPERDRNDRRCLTCHAPDLADGLAGVSCEACHGPGRLYSARHVMRDPELARALGLVDPGERTCAACHTESTPSLVRFDYGRKLPLIRHWEEKPQPQPPSKGAR